MRVNAGKATFTFTSVLPLRNEFDFWNVIMNTLSLLQSKRSFMLTLQETRSIHDSMNIQKIEFIAYIYILL